MKRILLGLLSVIAGFGFAPADLPLLPEPAVAQAAVDIGECRQSLQGEWQEDDEIQRGVTLLYVNNKNPTGRWAWGEFWKNGHWMQRVKYERSTLRGTVWDAVAKMECSDANNNNSIGTDEDWIGGWPEWPYDPA